MLPVKGTVWSWDKNKRSRDLNMKAGVVFTQLWKNCFGNRFLAI